MAYARFHELENCLLHQIKHRQVTCATSYGLLLYIDHTPHHDYHHHHLHTQERVPSSIYVPIAILHCCVNNGGAHFKKLQIRLHPRHSHCDYVPIVNSILAVVGTITLQDLYFHIHLIRTVQKEPYDCI